MKAVGKTKRGLHGTGRIVIDLVKESDFLSALPAGARTEGQRRFMEFAIGAQKHPFPTCLLATAHIPSNDEPVEVQIEIRAAELATVGLGAFRSMNEITGWNAHIYSNAWAYETDLEDFDWQAGWLAREIAVNRGDK